jgi:hypothetical protein
VNRALLHLNTRDPEAGVHLSISNEPAFTSGPLCLHQIEKQKHSSSCDTGRDGVYAGSYLGCFGGTSCFYLKGIKTQKPVTVVKCSILI